MGSDHDPTMELHIINTVLRKGAAALGNLDHHPMSSEVPLRID